MNLNQYDREAFVKAVMDDVPSIDFAEIARKKITEWEFGRMPESIKKALKEHPEWFERTHIYTPNGLSTVMAYCERGGYVIRETAPEVWAELTEIGASASAQANARDELERKLAATIKTCRTLKQAKERLPEFEKYLPADRTTHGTTCLPVANLVSELITLGWPKNKVAA